MPPDRTTGSAESARFRSGRLARGVALLMVALAWWAASSHRSDARPHRVHRPACGAAYARPGRVAIGTLQSATLCLLNVQRARHRLPALHANPGLDAVARGHAAEMVRRGYFSHRGAGGGSPDRRIRRARRGCRRCRTAENIAWRAVGATPAAIVRAWMTSPGHRANILNPRLRLLGTGIARGTPVGRRRGGTYVTDFAG